MKHGLKYRKLGRSTHARRSLLRNLVSSLLHHEMIKTTLPKAKEAARIAEKVITWGKHNTDPARRNAQAYLMPPHFHSEKATLNVPVKPTYGVDAVESEDPETFVAPKTLLPKVFTTLRERYENREGGYTRIQKFGRRPGDYAPVAIVSLVDGPRDIKFEMAARAAARETLVAGRDLEGGLDDLPSDTSGLRPHTAKAMERVLKFRGEKGKKLFAQRAQEFARQLTAEKEAIGHLRPAEPSTYEFFKPSKMIPQIGRRIQAGERLPGMSTSHSGLGLARGALARRKPNADRTPLFATQSPPSRSARSDVD